VVAVIRVAVLGLASRNYTRIPRLPLADAGREDEELVSIIVPARNEAARLPQLLTSLRALEYARTELIVVDDESSDATAEIATRYGCTVVGIEHPQRGWTGKNNACHAGAHVATGRWLLFTDADTCHRPDSLKRAVSLANHSGADLVSLLTAQHCRTFWERLLLPYAYCLYFVGVMRPNLPHGQALANGQYMLFRAETYRRIGGHESVRESIIEDVTLGSEVSAHGGTVLLVRGEDAVSVRMYGDLHGIWEGFSKNAFRFLLHAPLTGLLTGACAVSLLGVFPQIARSKRWTSRALLLFSPALALAPWYRRFGVPLLYATFYPLAAIVFQLIALDSMRRTIFRGTTTWKGRQY
jgi:chlorobactene glucosyltransferase